MRPTSSFAVRLFAAVALASMAQFGFEPGAAMADSAEHDKVLAEITRTARDAPDVLGLKIDFEAISSYSTLELETLLTAIPTDYEIILDEDNATPASRNGEVNAAAAPTTGCKTAGGTLVFIGGVTRAKLWNFKVSVHFCWDFGKRKVTSIDTPELQGHVYGPGQVLGWKYRGPHQGSPVQTPFRDTFGIDHYETYAQALFELCTVKLACAAESDPWVRVATFRDGSFRVSKGGEK
jgi:hypothetical protein